MEVLTIRGLCLPVKVGAPRKIWSTENPKGNGPPSRLDVIKKEILA